MKEVKDFSTDTNSEFRVSSELAVVECVDAYPRFRSHSSKQGIKINRMLLMIGGDTS